MYLRVSTPHNHIEIELIQQRQSRKLRTRKLSKRAETKAINRQEDAVDEESTESKQSVGYGKDLHPYILRQTFAGSSRPF